MNLVHSIYIDVHPPSTTRLCPVMYLASSEIKKDTLGAMSSGVAILFKGTLFSY